MLEWKFFFYYFKIHTFQFVLMKNYNLYLRVMFQNAFVYMLMNSFTTMVSNTYLGRAKRELLDMVTKY